MCQEWVHDSAVQSLFPSRSVAHALPAQVGEVHRRARRLFRFHRLEDLLCASEIRIGFAAMGWPTKLAFAALTLFNLALVLCGAWLALWTPVLFERERPQDQVMVVAMAIGIVAFPVVALICAILPWLLWVRWRGVAVATAILPVTIAVLFVAVGVVAGHLPT